MKVTMVMVSSVDGKTTKGEDAHTYTWTSKEDQQFFSSQIQQHNLIVMGSKTYMFAKNTLRLTPGKLRVILTRHPQKYEKEQVPGSLEFSDEEPSALMTRLEQKGYTHLLLVGGSEVNTLFLKQGLVNEMYLTLEPRLFGSGKMIIADNPCDIGLHLREVTRLNEQGTLLLKYSITSSYES